MPGPQGQRGERVYMSRPRLADCKRRHNNALAAVLGMSLSLRGIIEAIKMRSTLISPLRSRVRVLSNVVIAMLSFGLLFSVERIAVVGSYLGLRVER